MLKQPDDPKQQLPPIPDVLPPVPPVSERSIAPPKHSNQSDIVKLLAGLVVVLAIGLIGFAVWSFSALKDDQQTTSAVFQADILSSAKQGTRSVAADAEAATLIARQEAGQAAEGTPRTGGNIISPSPEQTYFKERQPVLKASVNSLGHRLVPVPGTDVLFSVWPARVSDYTRFAAATGTPWKDAGFPQNPNHPAVRVSYYNAKAFCEWLTKKELHEGSIPAGYEYRLPRDLEWSAAAGLSENPEGPPAWRSGAIADCFAWGNSWPPPPGSGNYDSRLRADSFTYTSPVGSFAPNKNGLYDLSGNVFEWVEDDFDETGLGCLRGGSWPDESPINLNLSTRCQDNKTTTHKCYGFRFVLAPAGA